MSNQVYPQPVVGAFILNPENNILLFKTHKWKDKYGVPGGKVELNESLEQALIREVKEETTLDIFDIKFITVLEGIYDKSLWKPIHFIFLNYVCKTNSSEVIINEEAQEFIWISLEDALKLDLNSYTRETIELLIKQ